MVGDNCVKCDHHFQLLLPKFIFVPKYFVAKNRLSSVFDAETVFMFFVCLVSKPRSQHSLKRLGGRVMLLPTRRWDRTSSRTQMSQVSRVAMIGCLSVSATNQKQGRSKTAVKKIVTPHKKKPLCFHVRQL